MTELADLLDELCVAVTGGDHQNARRSSAELAARAAEDFPALHAALDMLDYHGEIALINELMAGAWPEVQVAEAYSRPAVAAYASRASDHLIYYYLQSPRTTDGISQLASDLEQYFEVDTGRLETYLSFLAGEAGRRWQPGDFSSLDVSALSGLLVEFVGLAHRAGIPYGKAHLVREHLPGYFLDRQAGYLYPREDVAALLRSGQRPPPVITGQPSHPLLPDRLTMRNFLEKMLQTLEPQFYPAAAIVELLPFWLRFLEIRSLITGELHQEAAADLEGLAKDLAAAWQDAGDPILFGNVLPASANPAW